MRLQAVAVLAGLGLLFLRPPVVGQVTLDTPGVRAYSGSSRLRVPRRTWIVNGSIEQNDGQLAGSDAGADYHGLYAWREDQGKWFSQESGWFGVQAAKGSHFLRPGAVGYASLKQRREDDFKDVTHLMLSGRFRNLEGEDLGRVRLRVLNYEGTVIAEACSEDLASQEWAPFVLFLRVPAGAVSVETEIMAERRAGVHCDAFFDDLRLTPFSAVMLAGKPALSFPRIAEEYLGREDDDRRGRVLALLAMFAHYREPALDFVLSHQASAEDPDRAALVTGMALSGWPVAQKEVIDLAEWSVHAEEQLAALRALPAVSEDWASLCDDYARSDDRQRSRTAFRLLVAARSPLAIQLAADWHASGGEPARLTEAVVDLARHFSIDEIFESVLSPLLSPDADPGPRLAALQQMSISADRRLLEVVSDLSEMASGEELIDWIPLLAPLDSGEALATMVGLMPPADSRFAWQADRVFLQSAATMHSPDARRWFLREGLKHERGKVRQASLAAVDEKLPIYEIALLMGMANDHDPEVSAALASVFGKQSGREALNGLHTLIANRVPGVGAEAVRAYWDHLHGNPTAVTMCRKLVAQPRTWEMAVAATELLSEISVRRYRDLFVANMDHPARQLRAASYHALARDRRAQTVAELVSAVSTEAGPAMPELLNALYDLTGLHWGAHPLAWQNWWDGVAKGYRCPPQPLGQRMQRIDRSAVSYHGLSLPPGEVVIVLDLSPAMAGPLQDGVMLDEVRHSLRDLMSRFGPKHRFRFVACKETVTSFPEKAQVATAASVAEAMDWIDSLGVQDPAHGWTPLPLALREALVGSEVSDVVVLSDGGAAVGRTDSYLDLAQEVTQRNLEVGARIHVVQLGTSRAAWRVLKNLTDRNQGRLVRFGN